jgi:hypothetical protein
MSNAAHAASKSGVPQAKVNVTKQGTRSLKPIAGRIASGVGNEIQQSPEVDAQVPRSGLGGNTRLSANHVPTPAANAITSSNLGFSGFNGLSHADQRLAGTLNYTNTQFSLEPPDQALCVGGNYVVESVNTALQVFYKNGTAATAPAALNQFFGLAPEINRSTLTYGDFTSDPKCYYDSGTQRWFLTMLQIDIVPSTGNYGQHSHLEIAVSQSSDPTGSWNFYSIDTTDDGTNNTPSHTGCPCFGDQPLIGADANGFYVTTNEFPIATNGFNGTQIYAMSKTGLESGTQPTAVQLDAGALPTPDAGGIWYSIQPATTPPYGTFATNTEYFLSALQFSSAQPLDNRIAVWALTGTNTLGDSTPTVSLTNAIVSSEVYGQPGNAQQAPGSTPLGSTWITDPSICQKPTNTNGCSAQPENLLAGNDDRMNQVVYAAGELWSGVNTVIQPPNGPTRVGIAYFIVTPSVSNGQVSGTMANQGYIAANQENVLFPSIGVNASGSGVIGFTLVGPDYYPSAAYAPIDATNGAGAIHIAGAGAGPADGFTGYAPFSPTGASGRTERWGDYSAAVADSDGSIWLATEYIPGTPRTLLANWGTYISHVTP